LETVRVCCVGEAKLVCRGSRILCSGLEISWAETCPAMILEMSGCNVLQSLSAALTSAVQRSVRIEMISSLGFIIVKSAANLANFMLTAKGSVIDTYWLT